ncbi:TPR-like protein [Aureobasidium pullulans]|uniref:TPR-like protein n=1 Tax=Aureobasidium pullulans TaxID=5580 RepID=A0A4S8ZE39_AURPU|nr:TPR-like protein [Aureobasidium pullulans]
MSHNSTLAVTQLKQLIYYHLDNESPDNANFLAGRLIAIDPRNPDSSHLLALTNYRLRRFKAAYDCSQKNGASGRHLGCAYVLALACQELGKYNEGISALEKARSLWQGRNHWGKHTESSTRHTPDAAAVNTLLGKLWRGHGDSRRAGDCYIEAHKSNPFTWEVFQGLCDLGADIDMSSSFRMTPDLASAISSASATIPHQELVKDEPPNNSAPSNSNNINNIHNLTPTNDPFNPSRNGGDLAAQAQSNFLLPKIKSRGIFGNNMSKPTNQPTWETPTANGMSGDEDVEMGGIPQETAVAEEPPAPAAPTRRSRTALQRLGLDAGKDSQKARSGTIRGQVKPSSEVVDTDDATNAAQSRRTQHKRTISGHSAQVTDAETITSAPRRSNRLFSQITGSKTTSRMPADSNSLTAAKRDEVKKAKATGTKGRGPAQVGRVVSGNRKVMPPNPGEAKDTRAPSRSSAAPPMPTQKQALESTAAIEMASTESLLSTFRSLGAAYYLLSRYQVSSAIDAFKALPSAHRETPWVLAQLGKAYYEAAEYSSAEICFAKILKLQPTRIEDMEVYSTVLWQLKKPVQLAFLAHNLRDLDFNSPQTWCAVGNAFSLSREHEQAIACFKRATQVDPEFSYAWTLMGHELLTNEEFDAALASFRKGVGSERRGFGAWYGLGKCYERMGKWDEAQRHYRIAFGINPSNPVLAVCIGVIMEKLHQPQKALSQYTLALNLAPNSALARFKKARVLMSLRLYADALVELEVLKNLAPEEANVFFLLGKCFKGLGRRADSVRTFTTALNLDAKASQYIKEAMEALDDSDDDDMDDD